MNGFEINKIIAALIFTVLVVFGIGKISDIIFNVEKPSQAAYVVEAPTIQSTTSASSGTGSVDIKALLAMGTLEHGKKVFKNVLHVMLLQKVVKIKLDQFFGEFWKTISCNIRL